MNKQDKLNIQFLEYLECLTHTYGDFSQAGPIGKAQMRSAVAEFVYQIEHPKKTVKKLPPMPANPVHLVIDPKEFKQMGHAIDKQAAEVMRMFADLGLMKDRMDRKSTEVFLKKRGL